MEKTLIKLDNDLINSSATKIAVCLCIDVSGSMYEVVDCSSWKPDGGTEYIDGQSWNTGSGGQSRIDLLYEGIDTFLKRIRKDPVTSRCVELSVIAFSDDVGVLSDFSNVNEINIPKSNEIHVGGGGTDIGSAVLKALDMLEDRKGQYKACGVEYYRPMLVVMSDGANNGSEEIYDEACNRIHEMVNMKKVAVICVGMGPGSDLNCLSRLSGRSAKQLNEQKFDEFFKWLSKSVSVVSQSTPGDRIPLPPTNDWEEL